MITDLKMLLIESKTENKTTEEKTPNSQSAQTFPRRNDIAFSTH